MTFQDVTKVLIGPDVSNVNKKPLNSTLLMSQRVGFGIYKVGQGLITNTANFTNTGLDVLAHSNDAALKTAGVLRCRYFFLQNGYGRAQADRFWALSNELGNPEQVGHAVDIEVQNSKGEHPDLQTVKDFLARWREWTTLKLGGYSGKWFWSGRLGNPPWPGFDWLWDGGTYVNPANCTADPWQVLQSGGLDKQGVTPGYWNKFGGKETYDLRQYFSQCSIGGIQPCDVSVFPGTKDQLAKLWGINQTTIQRRYQLLVFATGLDALSAADIALTRRVGVVTSSLSEVQNAIKRNDPVAVIGGPAATALGQDPNKLAGRVQKVVVNGVEVAFGVGTNADQSRQFAEQLIH